MNDIIFSDKKINMAFEGYNFGKSMQTYESKMDRCAECVLKITCGFYDAHSITCICVDLKLLTKKKNPTLKAKRWAFCRLVKR